MADRPNQPQPPTDPLLSLPTARVCSVTLPCMSAFGKLAYSLHTGVVSAAVGAWCSAGLYGLGKVFVWLVMSLCVSLFFIWMYQRRSPRSGGDRPRRRLAGGGQSSNNA